MTKVVEHLSSKQEALITRERERERERERNEYLKYFPVLISVTTNVNRYHSI
jgi:hypothetical protein